LLRLRNPTELALPGSGEDGLERALEHAREREGPPRVPVPDDVAEARASEYLARRFQKLTAVSETTQLRGFLTELLSLTKGRDDNPRRAELLEEIAFLVHQVDTAVDFCKLGGHKDMLSLLSADEDESYLPVHKAVIGVITAATRNNPGARTFFVSAGAVPVLVEMLKHPAGEAVSPHVVAALTALLHHSNEAVKVLIELRGAQDALHKHYARNGPAVFDKERQALTRRVAVLLTSLFSDKSIDRALHDRVVEAFAVPAWCDPLVKRLIHEEWHGDPDLVDKMLEATVAVLEVGRCAEVFKATEGAIGIYTHIAGHWEQKEGVDQEFKDRIVSMIRTIKSEIKRQAPDPEKKLEL
jgi:hypothetical protein